MMKVSKKALETDCYLKSYKMMARCLNTEKVIVEKLIVLSGSNSNSENLSVEDAIEIIQDCFDQLKDELLKYSGKNSKATDEEIQGQISIETLEGGKYMPDTVK